MGQLFKTKALIDGTGNEPLYGACFEVEDGVIGRIGTADAFGTAYDNQDVVDLSDYYVLPGLIDSHTHLSINPTIGDQHGQMRLPASKNILRSMPHIRKDLLSGVTTMRIMGEENFIDIEMKAAIEQELVTGPNLRVAARPLVASNGHGASLTLSDGVHEVRKHARENLAQGADFLKLFVTGGVSSANRALDFCSYSREEIRTAVEEAAREGKYVAAHAHGGLGIDLCLDEGVRTIEHAAFITERQIENVINKNAWIVGTFTILYHPDGIEHTDFSVPLIREKVLRAREVCAENFMRVVQSSANLTLGTDSMHGYLSFEMKMLTEFGASNMEAICAATKRAAELCRVGDTRGTIETGKVADFIGLKTNPVYSIDAMSDVSFVYKNGKPIGSELF
jgi:imidazolonepropionase-like amidohydrolase